MRRSNLLCLSLVTTSSLLLAACGSDDDDPTDMPMSSSDMGGGMDGGMDGGMAGGMGHDESSPVADGARRIEVSATSFAFNPDEITVTTGEDVAIVFTSEDILHDFTIDELGTHVAAGPDETAEGGLRADEPGRYTFYCTVTGHRDAGMEGTLIVEAP